VDTADKNDTQTVATIAFSRGLFTYSQKTRSFTPVLMSTSPQLIAAILILIDFGTVQACGIYDTIQEAILTCAQNRAEPITKKWGEKKND